MYVTQCVHSEGCKITIPISDSNGPSRRYVSTPLKPKDERTCCIFIFNVAYFFNLNL